MLRPMKPILRSDPGNYSLINIYKSDNSDSRKGYCCNSSSSCCY